ncbi:MAG: HAD family hydrolase [Selenomonadaceae bacterium]|nr:HAD family hydrolase [Selenomonadaceae bacterium]
MGERVIFLDRDGVINAKAPEGDYIKSVAEFKFLPDIFEAVRIFNACGFKVIVVTNQRGIARGIMNEHDLAEIHEYLTAQMKMNDAAIDEIFYCPHNIGECTCRKPDIGMFLMAEKIFLIDKKNSFVIGDSRTDIQAGNNYGVRSIKIGAPVSGAWKCFENLLDAANHIASLY